MKEITLNESDRTIFTRCDYCNRSGKGVVLGDIYCMAFTKRQWAHQPVCENCGGKLRVIYEVK